MCCSPGLLNVGTRRSVLEVGGFVVANAESLEGWVPEREEVKGSGGEIQAGLQSCSGLPAW